MLIKILFALLSWIVLSNSIFYSLIQHHYFSFLQTCYLSAGSSALLISIAYLLFQNKTPNLYGNAKFANQNDIKKAGLFANKGILLGKAFGKDLMLDGYEHVILFAPTGTGKTTSITIPNLLQWHESCIVKI